MNSDAFVNRELSWLEFNRRVLEEAQDPSVPLLERVKFLAIFSSNLDEFFMIRVAALKRRIAAGDQAAGPDGMSSTETLSAVAARVHELVDEQHRCFLEEIQPLLAAEGIFLLRPKEASDEQQRFLEDYFRRMLLPVLTPLAVDPGHPFPYLGNRSLCLVASIRAAVPSVLPHSTLSVIHIPSQVLPRFVPLPDAPGKHSFMLLEDVIRLHLPTVYNGYEIVSSHAIRVTRDAFLQPRGGREDLLVSIEESLRERRLGTAVRLQHDGDLPPDILATLLEELELAPEDLFEGEGFAAFSDLFQFYTAVDAPRLKDRPLPPHPVPAFETAADMWSAIRASDVLVHHPYHTFDAVTRFVVEAATDPKVLAIKMTLYRVSPASPIAHALRTAVENGKEVAVLVELQARFDEEANIRWARALEEVGAHVVYGLAGFKTHCKACLVVRQEADGIRRYCHLATGNYNVRTATTYEDLGLFTSRESFGEDLTELFNLLTGYTRPHKFHHLLLAPRDLREGLIERGMCALRPEVPGLSDNIRCISIVDRFLEHARIFYFANAGADEYLLASADWMPRNLDRRVEITFPILDPALQTQVRTVLDVQLADTVKARRILPDGSSVRLQVDGGLGLRSQERLYEITGAGGVVPAASVLVDGGREID